MSRVARELFAREHPIMSRAPTFRASVWSRVEWIQIVRRFTCEELVRPARGAHFFLAWLDDDA
jgi:hypothetical protein